MFVQRLNFKHIQCFQYFWHKNRDEKYAFNLKYYTIKIANSLDKVLNFFITVHLKVMKAK